MFWTAGLLCAGLEEGAAPWAGQAVGMETGRAEGRAGAAPPVQQQYQHPHQPTHKAAGLAARVGRHRDHVAADLLKLRHQVLQRGEVSDAEGVVLAPVHHDQLPAPGGGANLDAPALRGAGREGQGRWGSCYAVSGPRAGRGERLLGAASPTSPGAPRWSAGCSGGGRSQA